MFGIPKTGSQRVFVTQIHTDWQLEGERVDIISHGGHYRRARCKYAEPAIQVGKCVSESIAGTHQPQRKTFYLASGNLSYKRDLHHWCFLDEDRCRSGGTAR